MASGTASTIAQEVKLNCKGCNKSFNENSILKHINHHLNNNCKKFYSTKELSTMIDSAKSRQKLAVTSWKEKNPNRVYELNRDWYYTFSNDYNSQRHRKYKEKKKKNPYQIAIWKNNLEMFLKDTEENTRKFKMYLKLRFEEENQMVRLTDVSEEMNQKYSNLQKEIDEKLIMWENMVTNIVEDIKIEIGLKKDWDYNESKLYHDFISAMFKIVNRYIGDDRQLFRYYVYDTLQEIASSVGQSLTYVLFKDHNTSYDRDKCKNSLDNYDKLKNQTIEDYKKKRVNEQQQIKKSDDDKELTSKYKPNVN